MEYRIAERIAKPEGFEDDIHLWTTRYVVQVKVYFFWVTVKEFSQDDLYLAEELYNLLIEEL